MNKENKSLNEEDEILLSRETLINFYFGGSGALSIIVGAILDYKIAERKKDLNLYFLQGAFSEDTNFVYSFIFLKDYIASLNNYYDDFILYCFGIVLSLFAVIYGKFFPDNVDLNNKKNNYNKEKYKSLFVIFGFVVILCNFIFLYFAISLYNFPTISHWPWILYVGFFIWCFILGCIIGLSYAFYKSLSPLICEESINKK